MNLQEKKQLEKIIRNQVRRSLQEQKMLEEGIFDMIMSGISSLGGGFIDAAQEYLATLLLRLLGIDADGILAKAFIAGVGNLEVGDFATILGGGEQGCQRVALRILETMETVLIRETLKAWGLSGTGTPGVTMQRAAENALREYLSTNLNQTLSTTICQLVTSGSLSGITDMLPDSIQSVLGGTNSTQDTRTGRGPTSGGASITEAQLRQFVRKTLKENKRKNNLKRNG